MCFTVIDPKGRPAAFDLALLRARADWLRASLSDLPEQDPESIDAILAHADAVEDLVHAVRALPDSPEMRSAFTPAGPWHVVVMLGRRGTGETVEAACASWLGAASIPLAMDASMGHLARAGAVLRQARAFVEGVRA